MNPIDDINFDEHELMMALAELAVSNGECASQLEIKDAELRDSLLRNIIAVFEPRLAASRPAPQQTTSKLGAWLAAALDDPKVCAEMKADIEAWMNAGEPPYLPAPVDREAVVWPESPIAIAQRGFEKWRAKEHNKKWFRKIDGTPIPNDVVVCIAQEFADTACPAIPVSQETPDTSELLKLAYDNMFDGEAREQVRRKLFE